MCRRKKRKIGGGGGGRGERGGVGEGEEEERYRKGVRLFKFSLSRILQTNKLECLTQLNFYSTSLMFAKEAEPY